MYKPVELLIEPARVRPGEGRLRRHRVAELVIGRGGEVCVAAEPSVAAGLTVMLLKVWLTVISTAEVVDSPPASVIVARKVYLPAWVKVARGVLGGVGAVGAKVSTGGSAGSGSRCR